MLNKNNSDFHIFTTNHPYFIELGLGSFNIWTLIDWWNAKDNMGRYLNRRNINKVTTPLETLGSPANGLDKLLGITPTTEFFWYGWKPNVNIENAGRFKKQNLYGMNGHNGGSVDDEWIYQVATSHNMNDINSIVSSYALQPPIIGCYADEDKAIPFFHTNSTYYSPLQLLNPIYSLIQLNKYISLFDDYYPNATWSKSDPSTHPPLTTDQAFGSWALLNEIKAAKGEPCIQWTGDVTFYVSQNNGLIDQCEITESVTFKLYLTDESMISANDKAITVKNLTVVGPKRDTLGPAAELDGERTSADQQDVSNHTAGEIDLQWNPVSKKWQSGNVNMLAKLVTDIGPGKAPSLSHLLSNDIKETLDDENNEHSYIPARGSGMPIRVQNSMPLQWSPNYLETKDTRCSTGNKDKLIVPVYNFNPKKAYTAGQEVLITYIDNVWHVSDLGEGDTNLATTVTASVGKWGSFTYLNTSYEFFFKAKSTDNNSTVNVTPRSAELNFHKWFYKNCGNIVDSYNNFGTKGIYYGISGGYNVNQPFDTSTHTLWTDDDRRGWLQTTSFDFLDSQIYGIRGKTGTLGTNADRCSISSTSATLNAAGNVIPFNNSEYPYRNSAHTGTFFGCVFPNGYNGTEVYDDLDRSKIWTVNSTGIARNPTEYFDVSTNPAANPFDDKNNNRNNSNVKCRATEEGGPLSPINPTEDGLVSNSWSRGTTKPDASMFYLGANGYNRRTIPADVMLNASPSGTYGSPIKPISLFSTMNTNSLIIQNNPYIYNLVNGGCWLYKVGNNLTTNDSAFDFEPVKQDNLMFRPLKLEGYLQFGSFMDNKSKVETAAKDLSLLYCHKDINGFYAEAARTQIDYTWPVSYYVADREFNNCKNNIISTPNTPPITGDPLKWGAWVEGKPYYNKIHRNKYWSRITGADPGALEWAVTNTDIAKYNKSDWEGAGAFGVITTSNKIKANTRIEFVTKNLYGMSAAAHGPFTVQGGYEAQSHSWGVGNAIDTYKQENIIDLSVRIYQGHPSECTVYDPRYFAVHHFNPGVDFLYGKYKGTGTIPVNTLGTASTLNTLAPRNWLREEFKNIRGANGVLLDSVYYDYPQASGVDIKEPSRYAAFIDYNVGSPHLNNGYYTSQKLVGGSLVFSDATADSSLTLQPPLMQEKYWQINTNRTGKLLPYRYATTVLGAPATKGLPVTLDYKPSVANFTVYDRARSLIVENVGIGYSVGDIIGKLDYGLMLKVTGTTLFGSITGLLMLDPGSGIPTSFIQGTGTRIGSISSSNFTMDTLTGAGSDFKGYFVSAGVHYIIACDPKPYLIKNDNGDEIVRIAAPNVSPNNQTTGFTAVAEAASYIDSTHTTAFNIPEALKSKDSSYDVFFHFHNDISFTWLACGNSLNAQPHGDAFNASECTEQHITIEKINLI